MRAARGVACGRGDGVVKIRRRADAVVHVVQRFFGRRHLGSIQGCLQTTNVAATGLGPLIIGGVHDLIHCRPIPHTALEDSCSKYSLILIGLAAASGVAGGLSACFLRTPRRRRKAGR